MEIIFSNKGGLKLCYKGFMYTKQITRKNKVWWRCIKRTSAQQCRGSLITNLEIENPEILKLHNHQSNQSEIQFAKMRNLMKRNATGPLDINSDLTLNHKLSKLNQYPDYQQQQHHHHHQLEEEAQREQQQIFPISEPLSKMKKEEIEYIDFQFEEPLPKERLFLIDADPGLDDAQAILMALAVDSIKVIGLTTVQGNASSHCSCLNALRLLKIANRLDIPVFSGCERPLVSPPLNAGTYQGQDGFGDVPDQDAPSLDMAQSEHAVTSIIRLINDHPGEVTLIALGPLTNIALAIRLEPTLGSKLKDCYIMGGNYRGMGNVTRSAEFNFANDPEAAQIVLTELKCPITLITWELCTDMHQSLGIWNKLDSLVGRKASFMHKIRNIIRNEVEECGSYILCEELAMAAAIDEGSILEMQDIFAEVETEGKSTKGQVVLDWRNLTEKPANVRIVTKMDMNRVEELLLNAFNE